MLKFVFISKQDSLQPSPPLLKHIKYVAEG